MSRDCKLYSIREIPNQLKIKYPELSNFKLYQYLGTNQNSAFLYALIHFFMSQKMGTELKKLADKPTYLANFSYKLAKLLKSYNGIASLFDELTRIDQDGQQGEIFLKEVCVAAGMTTPYGKIYPEKLAKYFGIQIVIISGLKYGNGNIIVHLVYDGPNIYFLIPQIESIARGQCSKCQKLTRDYFTPPQCKHQVCLNCLEKYTGYNGNYNCPINLRCQIVLKKVIQQFYEELKCKKELEIRKLTEGKKTEQSLDLSTIIQKCQKCGQEQPYRLFTLEGCNHKYCVQCMDSFFKIQKYEEFFCFQSECTKKFTKSQYRVYLTQLQEKCKPSNKISSEALLKCSKCLGKVDIKDQFTNDCGHSVCNKCILDWTRPPAICPDYSCHLVFNAKELQDYQSNMVLNCDGCKTEYLKLDLFKNYSCSHLICFDCIKKSMDDSQFMHCIEGCPRLLFGDKFQDYFENQQIKQIQQQELATEALKKSKQEEKNLLQQPVKEESKSTHGTSKSQHLNNSDSFDSKLIKNYSVQNLEDSSQSKRVDQKQSSAKQLSVIQDEGETKVKQDEVKNSEFNNQMQDFDSSQIIQFEEIQDFPQDQEGECTMCFTEFSQYNLKQVLDCKKHQVGVCCIKNFKTCPQCERKPGNNAIRVKEKLMLQKFAMQQDDIEETIVSKPPENINNYGKLSPPIATEKYYQIQNTPNYERNTPISYDRPVSRFQSNVIRHSSMDPRQITRLPYGASTQQPYRQFPIRTYY